MVVVLFICCIMFLTQKLLPDPSDYEYTTPVDEVGTWSKLPVRRGAVAHRSKATLVMI